MNPKVRWQLKTRKQRIARRLEQTERTATARPEFTASNIGYEIADRTRAIGSGGIGAVHLLVKRLGLDRAINDGLDLLKVHLPYHESDHVLNIAYNQLMQWNRVTLSRGGSREVANRGLQPLWESNASIDGIPK